MSDVQAIPASKSVSARVWKWIKWGLLALVLYFVGRQGYQLYQEQSESLTEIQIKPMWLILAGCCNFVAWLPSVWFWQRLMITSGEQVGFWPTARAYYCGHLGKYIPGKVSVLLIRATLLKEFGVRVSVSALTAAYETLAVMGVGLVVFLALVPYVFNAEQIAEWPAWIQAIQARPLLVPILFLFALFVSLPLVSRLLNLFSQKITKSEVEASAAEPRPTISIRLLYVGVFVFLLSWMLHGLSLGFVIASLGNSGLNWQEWPLWTAAISAAFSLGFAALFAPAGLGVREALIAAILAGSPAIGPVNAFVAALLIRIVSFASEILAAFVLYYVIRSRSGDDPASSQKETSPDTN
ncbi:lysylphosphatidylglycerol synthase transmembrane domain-containing protein [uncultured Gimesia sp.]|uniref:lysylphosphatidylglycerol synthase transmembrane domain-containing protein n=1 Tax=uncultured Gimesia sp. TaxID=1678688 RepID=UPI0030D6ECB0|tara:strand:- start:68246 stop:69304 length:1059 start_codon:yes stop_codon:yes gene_type:complete